MPNWKEILEEEFKTDYFQSVKNYISSEYTNYKIFPPKKDIFNAFYACSFDNIRCVIFGQDPYFNEGQAHGLAFSVQPGIDIPPSLRNIYKELQSDVGFKPVNRGCLIKWAKQGVLLLNSSLTVREKEPGSHMKIWKQFSHNIVAKLNNHSDRLVFLLWGNFAKQKKSLITNPKHLILESGHPSPLSVKHFSGCKHFSKTNQFLKEVGRSEIDWQL